MKFKFQVISMDKKGYILRYHDFTQNELNLMLDYLNSEATSGLVSKIEITRWNIDTGERE